MQGAGRLLAWQAFFRNVFAPWYTQYFIDFYVPHCPKHEVRAWRLVCARFGFDERLRRVVLMKSNYVTFPDAVFWSQPKFYTDANDARKMHIGLLANFNYKWYGDFGKFKHLFISTQTSWLQRKLLMTLRKWAREYEWCGHGFDPMTKRYRYSDAVDQVTKLRGVGLQERVELLFRILMAQNLPEIKFKNE